MTGAPADAAIEAIRRGGTVALLDDQGVGHLLRDARGTSPEDVVAMLDAGGGIFSVVLTAERCQELRVPEQTPRDLPAARGSRRIGVSVDAREGTTTGISAGDRANTARAVADPATRASDLVVPGHVPPLIAADAGVFAVRGVPEAALDLVRLAGGSGTAAVCAVLDESGRTASAGEVRAAAARLGLPLTTVTEVAARRIAVERPVRAVARRRVVTPQGAFTAVSLRSDETGEEHAALVRGEVAARAEVPLAIRTSSPVDDLLVSLQPSGESSLVAVLRRFARAEEGILIHLRDADPEDPRAFDLAAATLLELDPVSVRPLDASHAGPLRERGIEVARSRTAPRRRSGGRCGEFDYDVDTAI
ncbi:MAG: 3,4-dihydroxy-2-butanone-4-phosphate synthase [Actinobacteria bacterium]|nr:3,4-dihydroxy-2-butanone-4-phosphate synthase [Actinomycetota bacterium]